QGLLFQKNRSPPVKFVRSIRNFTILAYGMLPGRFGSFGESQDGTSAVQPPESSRDLMPSMRLLFGANSPIFALSREFYDQILALSYLGPLRSPPERHYIVSGADRESVGMRGERMPHLLFRRRREVLPKIDE